jgi:hypothetical protein
MNISKGKKILQLVLNISRGLKIAVTFKGIQHKATKAKDQIQFGACSYTLYI